MPSQVSPTASFHPYPLSCGLTISGVVRASNPYTRSSPIPGTAMTYLPSSNLCLQAKELNPPAFPPPIRIDPFPSSRPLASLCGILTLPQVARECLCGGSPRSPSHHAHTPSRVLRHERFEHAQLRIPAGDLTAPEVTSLNYTSSVSLWQLCRIGRRFHRGELCLNQSCVWFGYRVYRLGVDPRPEYAEGARIPSPGVRMAVSVGPFCAGVAPHYITTYRIFPSSPVSHNIALIAHPGSCRASSRIPYKGSHCVSEAGQCGFSNPCPWKIKEYTIFFIVLPHPICYAHVRRRRHALHVRTVRWDLHPSCNSCLAGGHRRSTSGPRPVTTTHSPLRSRKVPSEHHSHTTQWTTKPRKEALNLPHRARCLKHWLRLIPVFDSMVNTPMIAACTLKALLGRRSGWPFSRAQGKLGPPKDTASVIGPSEDSGGGMSFSGVGCLGEGDCFCFRHNSVALKGDRFRRWTSMILSRRRPIRYP